MSGGYFDHRDHLLGDWGDKLKCEKLPALRLLGQHLKELSDVMYAIDMHLSDDIRFDNMAIIDLVYSVTNSKTVQKFYKDEAEELYKLAEGFAEFGKILEDKSDEN